MSKDKNEQAFCTSIGGQALIEGILMRGPKKQSVVISTKDGFVTKVTEPRFLRDRYKILNIPLVRGTVTLVESMAHGMKALTYSAELMPEEDQDKPSKIDLWIEKKLGMEKAQKIIIGIAVVLGIALSLGLFIILPTMIVGFIPGLEGNLAMRSLLEGVVKLIIFFLYLWGVSKMKDVARLFGYHGAEHKSIFCYEKRLPLTLENVRKQSRFHPRCGTSFMLVAVVLGVLIGFLIQTENMFLRMGMRLLLLPLLVGVAYEINRWAGRHDNWFSRILTAPGKLMQKLTTKEPDDGMIECAIEAIKLVIPEEEGSDEWGEG